MSKELIDELMTVTKATNHKNLGDMLGIQTPTISKIYNGKLYPGPVILIRMHEVSGLSIKSLKFFRGEDKT